MSISSLDRVEWNLSPTNEKEKGKRKEANGVTSEGEKRKR
jgi:hypothetical protein